MTSASKLVRIGVLTGAAAMLFVVVSGFGRRGRDHGEFIKERVLDHIDEALDDTAPLSDAQRIALQALADKTHAALRAQHAARGADMDAALDLFVRDTIDERAASELQAHQRTRADTMAATMRDALEELHDILNPAQRAALAASIREHKKRFRD